MQEKYLYASIPPFLHLWKGWDLQQKGAEIYFTENEGWYFTFILAELIFCHFSFRLQSYTMPPVKSRMLLLSSLLKPTAELFSESGPVSWLTFRIMLQGKDLQLYKVIKHSRDHCLSLKKHGTTWLLSILLGRLSPRRRWSHCVVWIKFLCTADQLCIVSFVCMFLPCCICEVPFTARRLSILMLFTLSFHSEHLMKK